MHSINTICKIINGRFLQQSKDFLITEIVYDSRRIQDASSAVFFAINNSHKDGHNFVQDAYKKGIRNFVISIEPDLLGEESNIILVEDTLAALQQLAAFHRKQFTLPVIGITGSNGKTIVKEWLYQLLHEHYNIVRSPRSYNSQIGVPISVWQINEQHTLAIFEAGISQLGEMENLEAIIQPTIGIFTNIGEAHGENFSSIDEKAEEKMKLFQNAGTIIYSSNEAPVDKIISDSNISASLFSWGEKNDSTLVIQQIEKHFATTTVSAQYKNREVVITVPFSDDASVSNAITCWCLMLFLGYADEIINERMEKIHPIDMRLQLNKGINHCTIINDSYSADLTSLYNALNFLGHHASHKTRTIILSDFVESAKTNEELYNVIAETIHQHNIQKVICIGDKISQFLPSFLNGNIFISSYTSTENFVKHFRSSSFKDETILIKGARKFGFERIAQMFEQKVHQTQLEINLNNIVHNLKQYQKLLQPATKIMAMVKAFAYGSGGAEIAGILQYNNVDYLGVAYADEGLELRTAGISLPIMVMNADETSFFAIVENNLQPVLYSKEILNSFISFISSQAIQHYPVHIELETGMNRLGFSVAEINELGELIKSSSALKIESVFTHLAASEDRLQDDFTNQQYVLFKQAVDELKNHVAENFISHIANSAAVIRHPKLQMDMVRLGIGLYGVEVANSKFKLLPVATLKSTIAQLKFIKSGETVSYNRKGVVNKDSVIATVRIGYADGYSRKFGNRVGKMVVKGKIAPVIGTVCMDMTMIDVTEIPGVKNGDEVIVFGAGLPVQELSAMIETIPYEIMTSVSQRVKRIYFQE